MFQIGDFLKLKGKEDWLIKILKLPPSNSVFYQIEIFKSPTMTIGYKTISMLSQDSWIKVNRGHPLTKIFQN